MIGLLLEMFTSGVVLVGEITADNCWLVSRFITMVEVSVDGTDTVRTTVPSIEDMVIVYPSTNGDIEGSQENITDDGSVELRVAVKLDGASIKPEKKSSYK